MAGVGGRIFARLAGRSVGIVANNPLVKGGALDTDACEKITSFLVLCDSFNIPIVMFVDNPGFVIGTDAERKLPAAVKEMRLPQGALLRVATPGGGGFGPAQKRDADRVARDLKEGRITPATARSLYRIE